MGWHAHGQRPLGQRHRRLTERLIDGVEDGAVGEEHLVQRFPEILEQRGCDRAIPHCLFGQWEAESR